MKRTPRKETPAVETAAKKPRARKKRASNGKISKAEIKDAVETERRTGRSMFKIKRRPESLEEPAYRWMMDEGSIPGSGFAPVRWLKRKTIEGFCKLLGRPLNLDEAKLLVQPDGEKRTCFVDGIEFQPVRYVPFVPQEAEVQLKSGTPLGKVNLYYRGCFYQDDRLNDKEIMALGGCIYKSDEEEAGGSSVVMMARKLGRARRGGRFCLWGESLDHISARMADRSKGRANHKRKSDKIDGMVEVMTAKNRRSLRPGTPLNNGLESQLATFKIRKNRGPEKAAAARG